MRRANSRFLTINLFGMTNRKSVFRNLRNGRTIAPHRCFKDRRFKDRRFAIHIRFSDVCKSNLMAPQKIFGFDTWQPQQLCHLIGSC